MKKKIVLLIIWFCAVVSVTVQSQPGSTRVNLLNQSAENFPAVNLDVRVSADGIALRQLTDAAFQIEGDTPRNLNVIPRNDGSLALGVVVVANELAELPLIQETLLAFFTNETYYRAGDEVQFFILRNGEVDFQEPRSREAIIRLIQNLRKGGQVENIDTIVDGIQQQMLRTTSPARQIMVIGSRINNRPAAFGEAFEAFNQDSILVHFVWTHSEATRNTFPQSVPASPARFVNNRQANGFISVLGDTYTVNGALAFLYNFITSDRIYYRLNYESGSTTGEARQVRVTVSPVDQAAGSATFTYVPDFAPPVLEVVSPTVFSVTRVVDADGTIDTATASNPVYVRVSFPADGIDRPLETLRMDIIDPATEQTIQAPVELDQPQPLPNGLYEIPWSLADYNRPDTSTTVALRITAIDTYGEQNTTRETATINVQPIPVPEATPVIPEASVRVIDPRPIAPERSFIGVNTDDNLDTPAVNLTLSVVVPVNDDLQPATIENILLKVWQTSEGTNPAQADANFSPSDGLSLTAEDQYTYITQIPWDLTPYTAADTETQRYLQFFVDTSAGEVVSDVFEATVTVNPVNASVNVICQVLNIPAVNCPLNADTNAPFLAAIVLVIVVLIGAIIYLTRTSRGRQLAITATQTLVERATEIFNRGGDTPVYGKLIIRSGVPNQGDIAVTKDEFVIGRNLALGVDAVLDSGKISRQHFKLIQREDKTYIEDLNSSNKTCVNGTQLEPYQRKILQSGSEIRIGRDIFLEWQSEAGIADARTETQVMEDGIAGVSEQSDQSANSQIEGRDGSSMVRGDNRTEVQMSDETSERDRETIVIEEDEKHDGANDRLPMRGLRDSWDDEDVSGGDFLER